MVEPPKKLLRLNQELAATLQTMDDTLFNDINEDESEEEEDIYKETSNFDDNRKKSDEFSMRHSMDEAVMVLNNNKVFNTISTGLKHRLTKINEENEE